MTLEDAIETLTNIGKKLRYGCGNHGCRIMAPTGMGTNSVCQCTPRNVARDLLNIAVEVEKMGNEWK